MKLLMNILTLGISYLLRQHIKLEKAIIKGDLYMEKVDEYMKFSTRHKEKIEIKIDKTDQKIDELKNILLAK